MRRYFVKESPINSEISEIFRYKQTLKRSLSAINLVQPNVSTDLTSNPLHIWILLSNSFVNLSLVNIWSILSVISLKRIVIIKHFVLQFNFTNYAQVKLFILDHRWLRPPMEPLEALEGRGGDQLSTLDLNYKKKIYKGSFFHEK